MRPKLFQSTSVDILPQKDKPIKSAYYNEHLALELLPRLIEMLQEPTKYPFFSYESYGLTGRSLQMKISQAWAYLNDHQAQIHDKIECKKGKAVADAIPFEELALLRSSVEISRMDTGVVIKRRQPKLMDRSGIVDSTTLEDRRWEESLYAWLENIEGQDTPLVVDGITLSLEQIERLKKLLSTMEDLNVNIMPTNLRVERKTK